MQYHSPSEHGNLGSTARSSHSESTQRKSLGFSANYSRLVTCPVIDLTCDENMQDNSSELPVMLTNMKEAIKMPGEC